MNKKQQPFFNPELSGFCSQMAMILHSGISPLEGITIMLEDSTSDREKDILQQILDTLQETADFSLSLKETGLFPSYLVHICLLYTSAGIRNAAPPSCRSWGLQTTPFRKRSTR